MGQLCFDFTPDPAQPAVTARAAVGARNFRAGLAAEDQVARCYTQRGHRLLASRWRGQAGEIDLIFLGGDGVIFVEVKRAGNFCQAAEMLRPAQARRIADAAAEYLATMPLGQMTPARIDLALVDGQGRIEILENAIGH